MCLVVTCNSNETGDDIHFLFKCSCYHDLRKSLINEVAETKSNFFVLNDVEKLRHVVENHFIHVAKFIVDAMQRRKSVLYNLNHTFTASIIYLYAYF